MVGRVRLVATFDLMQAKYGLELVYNPLGGLQRVIQSSGVSIGNRGDKVLTFIILECKSLYRLQHCQQLHLGDLAFPNDFVRAGGIACLLPGCPLRGWPFLRRVNRLPRFCARFGVVACVQRRRRSSAPWRRSTHPPPDSSKGAPRSWETMRLKEMTDVKTDVKTDEKIMEEMKQAISNYTGSVTGCPPGNARAPAEGAVLKKNASVEWLRQHRSIKPTTDLNAMRKRMGMSRAQQLRIAKRNAAIKKRLGER